MNGNDIRGISGVEKQLAYSAPLDAVNSICAGIALVVVYQYLVDLSLEIHWNPTAVSALLQSCRLVDKEGMLSVDSCKMRIILTLYGSFVSLLA